jgi:signal transduction histidine kinase
MNAIQVLRRSPRVFGVAFAVAAAVVFLGEASYRRSVATLDALGTGLHDTAAARVQASRVTLQHTLLLGRIGVVALSAISLFTLFMVLRERLSMEQQRHARQRSTQAEQERLETVVRQRTAQLVELAQHLQTAREDERLHLARDLHDELGSLLTSAKLDAARIRSRLAGSSPDALERLAHLVETLNSVIALKRRIVENLHPSALSHLGLVETLEILAREYAERSGIEVHCDFTPVALSESAELVVYRLVQEAITNISKHAHARKVWLGLAVDAGEAVVTVRDDGVGFDTGAAAGSAFGLVGMRYRVEAAQGQLSVQSAPGHGTLIRMSLPAGH